MNETLYHEAMNLLTRAQSLLLGARRAHEKALTRSEGQRVAKR